MRGLWMLGLVALGATLVVGAKWNGYPTERAVKSEPPVLEAGDGFNDVQTQTVEKIHQHIVATLDDLEPTRGRMVTIVLADGTKTQIEAEGQFGMSRMAPMRAYPIDTDPIRDRNRKKHQLSANKGSAVVNVPHLVVSADGRVLKSDNIDVVWRSEGERLDVDEQVVNAMRKNLAAANLGMEFAFEVPGHVAWAKPLKLTKKECLSCHPSMKVGDTVAIATYFTPKN